VSNRYFALLRLLNTLGLQTKLLLAVFCSTFVLLGSVAVLFFEYTNQTSVAASLYLQTTSANWLGQANGQKSDLMRDLWSTLNQYKQDQPSTTAQQVQDAKSLLSELIATLERNRDELEFAKWDESRDGERVAYAKLLDVWKDIRPNVEKLLTNITEAKLERKFIEDSLSGLNEKFLTFNDSTQEVLETLRVNGTKQDLRTKVIQARMKWMMLAVLLCVAGASIVFILVVRSIVFPINLVSGMAKNVANGVVEWNCDLNERENLMERGDEIGTLAHAIDGMVIGLAQKAESLKRVAHGDLTEAVRPMSEHDVLGLSLIKMISDLSATMKQISDAASQTASGARQVSIASGHLSHAAGEQSANIEEISASVLDLTAKARSSASKALEAGDTASKSQQAAQKGQEQISATLKAMNEISASSQQISKVVRLIDDIAFQTNLLALNAAVEAARAGKHGKGFAVVANEVRNLAGRSAKAAQETAELIETSIQKVENGRKEAATTAESFKVIVEGAEGTAAILREIMDASNAQASSTTEIAQALTTVGEITQQNTATAEENAAAAQEMSSVSAHLNDIVSKFQMRNA
jgi:methyl-accepting chemotaxis protein